MLTDNTTPRRWPMLAAAAAVLALVIGAIVLIGTNGDDDVPATPVDTVAPTIDDQQPDQQPEQVDDGAAPVVDAKRPPATAPAVDEAEPDDAAAEPAAVAAEPDPAPPSRAPSRARDRCRVRSTSAPSRSRDGQLHRDEHGGGGVMEVAVSIDGDAVVIEAGDGLDGTRSSGSSCRSRAGSIVEPDRRHPVVVQVHGRERAHRHGARWHRGTCSAPPGPGRERCRTARTTPAAAAVESSGTYTLDLQLLPPPTPRAAGRSTRTASSPTPATRCVSNNFELIDDGDERDRDVLVPLVRQQLRRQQPRGCRARDRPRTHQGLGVGRGDRGRRPRRLRLRHDRVPPDVAQRQRI